MFAIPVPDKYYDLSIHVQFNFLFYLNACFSASELIDLSYIQQKEPVKKKLNRLFSIINNANFKKLSPLS